jgi:hypothetical protein
MPNRNLESWQELSNVARPYEQKCSDEKALSIT